MSIMHRRRATIERVKDKTGTDENQSPETSETEQATGDNDQPVTITPEELLSTDNG